MARGDDVRHPVQEWQFRFGDLAAEKGWRQCVMQAPGPAEEAWEKIVSNPRRTTQRQHQLKGQLASGEHSGRRMERWQYELTGGARLWYLIDDAEHTVWLVHAGPGHPKASERVKGRRRG